MKQEHAKNMTTGSPLKLILSFSLPLLLGNIFQQTYNMVDTSIVGQTLGAKALAAVGASTSVQFLVLGFCQGLCLGFNVPIGQRFGAKDEEGMHRYEYVGIVMIFLGRTLCLLFLNQSQAAALDAAALYLRRMGYLFWVLSPLNVLRMSMQGMSFANRAMFAGVMEMAARTFVSLVFVSFFGFDAITWTDQAAWISGVLYALPMCLHSLKQVNGQFELEENEQPLW